MSISADQWREMAKKPQRQRATRKVVDGINFPSHVQARYYLHLRMLALSGVNDPVLGIVKYWLRDVRFDVLGSRAEIDFMVVAFDDDNFATGGLVSRFIDVKGSKAPSVMRNFRRNKKQIETAYPVEIEVVRQVEGRWEYSDG